MTAPVRALGDLVAEAKAGFASGERVPDGVAQVRMNNVTTRGTWDWSQLVRVPRPKVREADYLLHPGDVLFNNTNSVELVGKTALFAGFDEPITYSNHFTRLRFTDDADPMYIALWLRQQWQAGVFARTCHRWVGQAAIGTDALFKLTIPLPPLAEQGRIAALLTDKLAMAEGAGRRLAETAALTPALRAVVYYSAFKSVVPLSVRAETTAPNGWRWVLLTELARLESGHTPSRSRPDWWGGDIPWIALPDIRALDGQIAMTTAESTNEEGIAHSAARVLPTGTVVLSRTASVGFVTRMGTPMATSQDFVNWVCGPDLDPEFLSHLLTRARSEIRSLASGAVHKTVYFPTVMAFRVCVPRIDEQGAIARSLGQRLRVVDELTRLTRQQAEDVETLSSACLKQVFAPPVSQA